MFNLKQALSSFGEICLDEVSEQAALPFFKEACELGDRVFSFQEEVYKQSHGLLENDEPNREQFEQDSVVTAVNKDEEIYGEQGDAITINSLVETLTTSAEDLSNLSYITDDPTESEKIFNEALEKLKKAEELAKQYQTLQQTKSSTEKATTSQENGNGNGNGNEKRKGEDEEEEEEEEEVDLNTIYSTYATILSSRGEHLFNTMGIFDAIFFENALEYQNKVIDSFPESSNSLLVYQQKAQELCNKGDILCSFAETLMSNGESIDEHSPSQEMYREALAIYEKAHTFEDSNNSIICKIGDMNLILANNYLLLSENKQDEAYQTMRKLVRKGLDVYKKALKNSTEQPIEPEIYLRIAKGLSYFDDLTRQCQEAARQRAGSARCPPARPRATRAASARPKARSARGGDAS